MATYVTGTTEYIPQFQPFQPDYNFLGNILENKQSKYDANYAALSKTYGSLLNSPMMREDNMAQRDEFFKMIDNDIKKMSGLDLSQQQNVDAANKVFSSFYDNKFMVKDMVFTKEYNRQLQIGENYRNCIDQDKCGGKYWDTGMQGMQYRADEFKNASRDASLNMGPGRFVPQINVQEKAMKYAQELFGKSGGFGIQSVGLDKTGRYIVTTKNGQQLASPMLDLLMNQFGKDQNIKDMYTEQGYVQRKSFVKQNAAKYNGDENLAEDEYFKLIDQRAAEIKEKLKTATENSQSTTARKDAAKKEIETKGSTGNDALSNDYFSAAIDADVASETLNNVDKSNKMVDAFFDKSTSRETKRRLVDGMMAESYMEKDFLNSSVVIANLTGEQTMEADPYAEAQYQHSLDMVKLEAQYDLMDRNAKNKAMYDVLKEQLTADLKKKTPGNVLKTGPQLPPVRVDNYTGTQTTDDLKEGTLATAEINAYDDAYTVSVKTMATGYANTLISIMNNPSSKPGDKAMALDALNKISLGTYDSKTGQFRLANGKMSNNPVDVFKDKDANRLNAEYTKLKGLYGKSYIPSQNVYFSKQGAADEEIVNLNKGLLDGGKKILLTNNAEVKKYGKTEASIVEGTLSKPENAIAWDLYFNKDNSIKSKEQFIKDYAIGYVKYKDSDFGRRNDVKGSKLAYELTVGETREQYRIKKYLEGKEQAEDKYEEMSEQYNKIYNSGKPSIKPLYTNSELLRVGLTVGEGGMTGGRTSGALVHQFNSMNVADGAFTSLLSLQQDINLPETIITNGNFDNLETAIKKADDLASLSAQQGLRAFLLDGLAGNLSSNEKKAYAGMVAYMDVALGDSKMSGVHIRLPQSYIDEHKKKGKGDKTWADTMDANLGIGMYFPKATATNQFSRDAKLRPYDKLLQYQDVNIDIPSGGNVKILKANDGKISAQGTLIYYNINDQGQVEENRKTLPVGMYDLDADGKGAHDVYIGMKTWLADIAQKNSEFLQNNSKNLVKDVNKLPEIQTQRQQQANPKQPSLADLFLGGYQQLSQTFGQQ